MKLFSTADTLARLPLFAGITPTELAALLGCVGAGERLYARGDLVAQDGEASCSLGVVVSGDVHMVGEDIWGGRSFFAALGEGDIFGESAICADAEGADVSYLAAGEAAVLFMPYPAALRTCPRVCGCHHRLIENMVSLIAKKNVRYVQKLEITSKKTIRERILTYLSQQARACGETYFISPLRRTDLADYLCVDRSALTRELTNMKRDGLLDYDRNTFRLLRREA